MDNNQVKWAIRKRKVAAKRKLKEFQQVQDRQQKCRKKRREDECSKRTKQIEKELPIYLSQIEKETIFMEFETKTSKIKHSHCPCCHKTGINVKVNRKGLCSDCDKYNDKDYLLKAGALPIWYKDNVPQYHVPCELADLSLAEKMLIQLHSPFIPLEHIKNGTFGLSGHVCSFEQDVQEFVNRLPRHKDDITMLKVLKVVRAEIGANDKRNDSVMTETYRISKPNVGKALRWLKEYNEEYKSIEIDMSALDWLEGSVGTMDSLNIETDSVVTREDKRASDQDDDPGPNPAFTRTLELEGSNVKTFGYLDETARAEVSPDDRQIHNEILQEIDQEIEKTKTKTGISVKWPNSGPVPINEFSAERLFARAYPWLFPGGIGDVKDFPGCSNGQLWGKNLLYYEDGRFTKDKFFIFFALNYITRQRNASGGNWFINNFSKGCPETLSELKETIQNGNTSFVNRLNYFNRSIKGSSPFWFSKRQELYTWINHHVEKGNGAPNYFITLSCCEHYWIDIILLLKERLRMAGDDTSKCYIGSPKLSQILNDYAIVVQEYFQQRVEIWLQTVGKKVLDIAHYWIRYEFAPGRGQIHAHLLAIVKDKTFLRLIHHEKSISNERRDARLAEWADKTLGLTASFDDNHKHKDILPHESPCTFRFLDVAKNDIAKQNDVQNLMQFCQQHQCSKGFCLKPDQHKKSKLVCKCGAGTALTPGMTDTPGFPLSEKAEVKRVDGKHLKLHMPRNHARLNQTSKDVLQSWRGNCDVSLLLYESDPDHPNVKEISRVTDYVVSYNTKGNSTWMEEMTTSKNIIQNAESITEDKGDVQRVCKQIMNKAATRRLISKQEGSVMVANLHLTKCSEYIECVSISLSKKLSVNVSSRTSSSKFISVYAKRPLEHHHMSLHQYYSFHREVLQHKAPAIPHYVGVSGNPCFPVTEPYARHVLVCYKPWTTYPDSPNWADDFHNFINSASCPTSARLTYDRVMQRHFEGTKFVDLKASSVDHSGNPISKEDQVALFLTGMGVKEQSGFNTDILDQIERGVGFSWDKKPVSRFAVIGEETVSPEDWLRGKINQQEERQKTLVDLPKKSDGADFELNDLYPDQLFIAYQIMDKLHEFMSCDDYSSFKPLRCTIVGQGGTGKTVMLKTVISVIRRLFCNSGTCKPAAPTGVSAFNVGGETIHRLTCRGLGAYEANSLSPSEKDKLFQRFCDLLVIIIDERSMVCSSLFGTTSQILGETIYSGGMGQCHHSFGGAPVVAIAGDDCQLAAQYQGAIECRTRCDGNKMTEKGRQCFRECAQTVYQLSTSRRLSDKKEKERELMEAVRDGDNITDQHFEKLCSLHLNKMRQVHGPDVVEKIKAKGIYLFWTNDKRIQHNLDMLVKTNSPSNPTAILKTKCCGSKYAKGVNAHFRGKFQKTAMICIGAKVAIQGCNFLPLWGLHNGACGDVKEIVFAPGKSPNNNDLPLYVVCDFPLFCGPPWDSQHPTYVPIPTVTINCSQHCCTRTYIPLDLAFARTIHKFQGLSAGPVDPGKIPNMYECIICDPDIKASESTATGLFYTGVSRATSLGDENG